MDRDEKMILIRRANIEMTTMKMEMMFYFLVVGSVIAALSTLAVQWKPYIEQNDLFCLGFFLFAIIISGVAIYIGARIYSEQAKRIAKHVEKTL